MINKTKRSIEFNTDIEKKKRPNTVMIGVSRFVMVHQVKKKTMDNEPFHLIIVIKYWITAGHL